MIRGLLKPEVLPVTISVTAGVGMATFFCIYQLISHNDIQLSHRGGRLSIQQPQRPKLLSRERTLKTLEDKFGVPNSQ